MSYWQKSGATTQKIANDLEDLLGKPEGSVELHRLIAQIYEHNFGREPTATESAYWLTVVRDPTRRQVQKPDAPDFVTYNCYAALMNYFPQWLKTDAADGERRNLVNRSYFEVFGRVASVEELNYWRDRIAKDGTPYYQLTIINTNWLLGDSPQQTTEVSEMIRRAYTTAGKPLPTESQEGGWVKRLRGQGLTFKQLVTMLKNQRGSRYVATPGA